MINRFVILLQSKSLGIDAIYSRDPRAGANIKAMGRGQGDDGMAYCGLLRTGLKDKRFPELRFEYTGELGGRFSHEPVEASLFFGI